MRTEEVVSVVASRGWRIVLAALVWAGVTLEAAAAPVGTGFTYQGKLESTGGPVSGLYNFQFKLFDADNNQIGGPGNTQTVSNVAVASGLFSVAIDFGSGVFDGDARWLEIHVQGPGDPGFTALAPRQPITAAPYALYALGGAGGGGGLTLPFFGPVTSPSQDAFKIQNNATSATTSAIHGVSASTSGGGTGVIFGEATGTSGGTLGVYGLATASPGGTGVVGKGGATGAWFESFDASGDGSGVWGVSHTSANGAGGVKGVNNSTTGSTVGTWGIASASATGTGVAGHGGATGGYFQSFSADISGLDAAGVYGVGNTKPGVKGVSANGQGVRGEGLAAGVYGKGLSGSGVYGEGNGGFGSGVYGVANGSAPGVLGFSASGDGVSGTASAGRGVLGTSTSGTGVHGESTTGWGMYGRANGTNSFGVFGHAMASGSSGIFGQALAGSSSGVVGRNESGDGNAVYGYAPNGAVGVFGYSLGNDGVVARTDAPGKSGIWAHTYNSASYAGVFTNFGGGVALIAQGRAQVGILEITGADLIEKFDTEGAALAPGTVAVIDGDGSGSVRASAEPYDARVAGVVSGAGGIPHGIHLGQGSRLDGDTPLAMTGRVYVKCTTENGPIRPGDRLTTSSLEGHAMRATNPDRSQGAVIGKALGSLERGTGLVLVLVNLQ